MAKVRMQFTLSWKGPKKAQLFYLLDGGVVVPLASRPRPPPPKRRLNFLGASVIALRGSTPAKPFAPSSRCRRPG